eukprot:scaffold1515_cov162-Amphora_coffeaeformis.AAC.3
MYTITSEFNLRVTSLRAKHLAAEKRRHFENPSTLRSIQGKISKFPIRPQKFNNKKGFALTNSSFGKGSSFTKKHRHAGVMSISPQRMITVGCYVYGRVRYLLANEEGYGIRLPNVEVDQVPFRSAEAFDRLAFVRSSKLFKFKQGFGQPG